MCPNLSHFVQTCFILSKLASISSSCKTDRNFFWSVTKSKFQFSFNSENRLKNHSNSANFNTYQQNRRKNYKILHCAKGLCLPLSTIQQDAVSEIFHGNAAIYYYSIFSLEFLKDHSLKKRERLFMERYLKTELLKCSAERLKLELHSNILVTASLSFTESFLYQYLARNENSAEMSLSLCWVYSEQLSNRYWANKADITLRQSPIGVKVETMMRLF